MTNVRSMGALAAASMRRRDFVGLLGAIAAWPEAVLGATGKRRPVVARLSLLSKDASLFIRYMGQILAGMRELGYVEGLDFDMVYRFADFHADRLRGLAAELVQLNPDVIITGATIDAVAASEETDTIPIVVPAFADPVGLGFAANDARPTRNLTGISPYVKGLPSKQLELAREIVAGAMRIGLLDDVTDPKAHPQRQEIEATARRLEIEIVPAEVRTAADVNLAYESLAAGGVELVIVEESNM